MTRAIVYVTTSEYVAQANRCMQYLKAKGYQFEGLIRDDWTKVQHMFANDGASVAIVDTEARLDPNRKGRIEVAKKRPSTNERGDIPPDPGPRSARNRRPRPV